jgi:hypothetical protein
VNSYDRNLAGILCGIVTGAIGGDAVICFSGSSAVMVSLIVTYIVLGDWSRYLVTSHGKTGIQASRTIMILYRRGVFDWIIQLSPIEMLSESGRSGVQVGLYLSFHIL